MASLAYARPATTVHPNAVTALAIETSASWPVMLPFGILADVGRAELDRCIQTRNLAGRHANA